MTITRLAKITKAEIVKTSGELFFSKKALSIKIALKTGESFQIYQYITLASQFIHFLLREVSHETVPGLSSKV